MSFYLSFPNLSIAGLLEYEVAPVSSVFLFVSTRSLPPHRQTFNKYSCSESVNEEMNNEWISLVGVGADVNGAAHCGSE